MPRRSKGTHSSRHSDARAWSRSSPAPGGGAGLREVDARYIGGTSQVDGGHSLASPAADAARCCLRSARVAWWPPSPPGAVAGPRRGGSSPGRGEESREPGVTVRIGSTRRSRPGIRGRAVENGRSNRISEVWQYHDHAPVLLEAVVRTVTLISAPSFSRVGWSVLRVRWIRACRLRPEGNRAA